MRYFVGAYATSPAGRIWDPVLEQAYYDRLKTFSNLQGLEHPFTGTLHEHDDDWFFANIDPNWNYVFTCVPGTMAALARNPHFGIASDNVQGRNEALAFMRKACDAIAKLNAACGREAVRAIEVQTAPDRSKAASSARSLQTSLAAMLEWDWHGAKIVVEHCDALVKGQTHAKGFLSLQDEIAVVESINQKYGSDLGIVINWARSAIETRSTDGVLEHIQLLKTHGLLKGLMFSGVSDKVTEYGAWKDTHMPAAKEPGSSAGAEGSLLTSAAMHQCLAACGDALGSDSIVGIKLGIRPADAPLEDRVAYNRSALAMLDAYFHPARWKTRE